MRRPHGDTTTAEVGRVQTCFTPASYFPPSSSGRKHVRNAVCVRRHPGLGAADAARTPRAQCGPHGGLHGRHGSLHAQLKLRHGHGLPAGRVRPLHHHGEFPRPWQGSTHPHSGGTAYNKCVFWTLFHRSLSQLPLSKTNVQIN